jgi:hypothetical protein
MLAITLKIGASVAFVSGDNHSIVRLISVGYRTVRFVLEDGTNRLFKTVKQAEPWEFQSLGEAISLNVPRGPVNPKTTINVRIGVDAPRHVQIVRDGAAINALDGKNKHEDGAKLTDAFANGNVVAVESDLIDDGTLDMMHDGNK